MKYYISKIIEGDFEVIEKRITEKLQLEDFGIITEIDMKAKLKEKLDIDFRKYKILGVCNPAFAYKALTSDDKIGTMLPCNFIIQEIDNGYVEIASIDPVVSMMSVVNPDIQLIASAIKIKLASIINSI